MKLIIFWILFLDFFIVIYSNETINQEDVPKQTNEVVLEIYKENFDQLLKENSIMIVEFYAPWYIFIFLKHDEFCLKGVGLVKNLIQNMKKQPMYFSN